MIENHLIPSTTLTVTSSFSGQTDVYIYLSENPESNRVLYVLKGIYGYHISGTEPTSPKLDRFLISELRADTSIVICNTGRLDTVDPSSKEAFVGKDFNMEVQDVQAAFQAAAAWLDQERTIVYRHVFGHSLGGTIAVSLKSLFADYHSITILGSGCGGGDPDKPLRANLDQEKILESVAAYTGYFTLIQGSMDTRVPLESGEMIFSSAESAQVKQHIVLAGVDHTAKLLKGEPSGLPYEMIKQIEVGVFERSEKST